jgi:hypothetical protein
VYRCVNIGSAVKSRPHCEHDSALHRWEGRRECHQADLRLRAIKKLLYSPQDFLESELKPILERREYPLTVERALALYMMMAKLMRLCEPKGAAVGPACTVQPIRFEELTLSDALELRNGIGLRVAFHLNSPAEVNHSIVGLSLLSDEEKLLYERIKPYFQGRGKPTLKILAARLLRDSEDRSFSDRSIVRYIEILRGYEFIEPNYRRDYLIRSVDRYGMNHKSAKESFRYVMAQALIQIGQVWREQLIPAVAETIQLTTQTAPIVVQQLPQYYREMQLLANAMPHIRDNIVGSIAQLPVVVPQLRLALTELHKSLQPKLAMLAHLNLNVRQN